MDNRKSKRHLGFDNGGEGYIARDHWCYNCGENGHLGDVSYEMCFMSVSFVTEKHKIRIVRRHLILIALLIIRHLVPSTNSVDLSHPPRLLFPKLNDPRESGRSRTDLTMAMASPLTTT